MKTLLVIPARLASTRLPNKMLLRETGKTLIEHTYRAAEQCRADDLIVAADDQSVVQEVAAFGGNVCLTSPDHQSGTDRVAEVAAQFPEYEIVVNIQGDEPELVSHDVDAVIELLKGDSELMMSTLAVPIQDRSLVENPACVKVVIDGQHRALYFSRAAIPCARNPGASTEQNFAYLQHVGIYAYRRNFLLGYSKLPSSRLEKIEALEQLRALEAGYRIGVFVGENAAKGIDTPEDYRAFVRRQSSC